jgi:hypothetical protein
LKIRFWLGLLNSRLFWFFIKHTGYVLRGGYYTFKTNYINPFPVPKFLPFESISTIIENVDILTESKGSNIKNELKTIDEIIYSLYGLSANEIIVIEKYTSDI